MSEQSKLTSGRMGACLLASLLAATVACSSTTHDVPAITPVATGEYHVGKFVWYDLLTHDVPAVQRFYGELFGWEFEGGYGDEGDFTLITYDAKPIGGIVYGEPLEGGVSRARWIPSLSVADVDGAVEQTLQAGGTVYFEAQDVGDRGRMAVVGDPQGAILSFVKTAGGDPGDEEPPYGDWLWTELWTHDVAVSSSFYQSLVGYERDRVQLAGEDYDILLGEGRPRAGVKKLPWEEVMPNWLPYIRVQDPAAIVGRVETLGGRVLVSPSGDVRSGSVGLIADPSGAVLAVQKWPIEEEQGGR